MPPGNLLCLLACIFSINTAAHAAQVVQTIERTLTVTGRPSLVLRNTDGRTKITAGNRFQVQIRAIKEVSHVADENEARRVAQGVEVRIEQAGNRLEIEARYPRHSESFFGSEPQVMVHFEVTAPKASDVDARSTEGSLDVDGFDGRLDLGTTDGNLAAIHCSGRIEARTGDGSLNIDDARGEVSARSGDGRVALDGILRALEVKSGDGRVNVTVRPGSKMEGDWSIRTRDGDVRLNLPVGFSANLDASSSDGRIESDLPITLCRSASKRRLVGKLYSGGSLLRIKTNDGDITIFRS